MHSLPPIFTSSCQSDCIYFAPCSLLRMVVPMPYPYPKLWTNESHCCENGTGPVPNAQSGQVTRIPVSHTCNGWQRKAQGIPESSHHTTDFFIPFQFFPAFDSWLSLSLSLSLWSYSYFLGMIFKIRLLPSDLQSSLWLTLLLSLFCHFG
jgi:hypothetical protein